jgi:glycerol kinase
MSKLLLAIDQGTTGTTALVVDTEGQTVGRATVDFPQHFPKPGWVEHDPKEIWASVEAAVRGAFASAKIDGSAIAAIGITNQRETTLVWDRATHEPIANAIVWQCRRTADTCDALRSAGHEARVREVSGLVLDAYFSGTKVAWILDHVEGARARAEKGELAFGTVDSFLVWRLTSGLVHVTDATNASRTLLMNLRSLAWDAWACELFRVPPEVLPKIVGSAEIVGTTRGISFLPDGVPIAGIAGDQQAALFGQACFELGDAKCTYGTGAFALVNVGSEPVMSKNGLVTTVGFRIGNETTYALEGSSFIAGAAVQWLRDGLGFFSSAAEIEALAKQVPSSDGVVFVPALSGLGTPHWDPHARGTLVGLTRGSTRAHVARAALEAIAFQVADVLDAMSRDAGIAVAELRVDGGASRNDLLMQMQADLCGVPVLRPRVTETTALGAALLAGLAVGVWTGAAEIEAQWAVERRFEPRTGAPERAARKARWREAVARSRGWTR